MSDTLDLLDGIAALLAAAVPDAAWNPNDPYTDGQVGIFDMLMPTTPDEVLVVTWVPQAEDPADPTGSGLLQVRARGAKNAPRRPLDILDAASTALLGATHIPLNGTGLEIIQVTSRVRVPMGMDESKRWDWSDNYTCDVAYTPTILRPAGGWD
ncbi:minor capsid protein [Humibacter ginsenosidimutans]|uniref:DUF3168 domain-containing protein n=1 Tax=Humibacter ginsenosidimutans TaxID=2599293 RepID=A0A5B8M8L7_9MICO|nr:minor capsid protein [Humibacter ginsenosidimutans]QDZ15780.1 hypothetical protein FPZ11_14320 [Humibacter ginsenosidimutans]